MDHHFCKCFERIELAPLSLDDAEKLRILRNKNRRNFFNSAPISKEDQRLWYQNYLHSPDDYMFSVFLRSTGQWVGAAGIYQVDQVLGQAEFGRLLIDRESTQERGLGAEATSAACLLAFGSLGISTIILEVYADNLPAIRSYQKCGFSEVIRSFDEQHRQIIHMSLKNWKEGL